MFVWFGFFFGGVLFFFLPCFCASLSCLSLLGGFVLSLSLLFFFFPFLFFLYSLFHLTCDFGSFRSPISFLHHPHPPAPTQTHTSLPSQTDIHAFTRFPELAHAHTHRPSQSDKSFLHKWSVAVIKLTSTMSRVVRTQGVSQITYHIHLIC